MDVDPAPTSSAAPALTSSAVPKAKQSRWATPNVLPSRQVRPDTLTPREAFQSTAGKETDPGRMAIYLCLLDDNPHLHPSLAALHKHRLAAHGIPLPPHPEVDHPIPSSSTISTPPISDAIQGREGVPSITVGEGMEVDDLPDFGQADGGKKAEKAEWLMWKFGDEEEQRRKAFLPLA